MSSSEQYKRQIMNDLAQGDVESFEDARSWSKNTQTLMILPSAHRTMNVASCLVALSSRPYPNRANGTRTATCDHPN